MVSEIRLLKLAALLLKQNNTSAAVEVLNLCSNVPANVWGQIEESTYHRSKAIDEINSRVQRLVTLHQDGG